MTETFTTVSTLECSETVQVKVRPVPAYRGAVRLAEMVTLGWGTVGIEEGQVSTCHTHCVRRLTLHSEGGATLASNRHTH